jgi:hypothetical protein
LISLLCQIQITLDPFLNEEPMVVSFPNPAFNEALRLAQGTTKWTKRTTKTTRHLAREPLAPTVLRVVLDKISLAFAALTLRVTRRATLNELAESSTLRYFVNALAVMPPRLVDLRYRLAELPPRSTPCSNRC